MKGLQTTISIIVSIFCTLVGAISSPANASDWPQWGGPNGNFTVNDAGVLQQGQKYSLRVSWRKDAGSSYSAVSIVGDRAVTTFSDGNFDYIIALDANDGTEIWRFKVDSTYLGYFGSHNGFIATPLIAGDKVISLHPKGRLQAVQLATGELAWETQLVTEHNTTIPFYGISTSPLYYENTLYVQTGGMENSAISAFDVQTGHVIWSTVSDKIEYQSPHLLKMESGTQLICVGSKYLTGLKPETGDVLWQYPHGGDEHPMGAGCANLVSIDDSRFYLKSKGSGGELIQVSFANEQFAAQEVWSSAQIKSSYIIPVYHEGHLFGYNSRIFTAVNAETGERAWRSRTPGDGLPIIIDGHLVVITKRGKLSIAPASADGYDEIASLQLFDSLVWSPASFANGKLYLRSMDEIAAVDILPMQTETEMAAQVPGKVLKSQFAQFVAKVELSNNKTTLVDEFMAQQKSFPVIEGDDLVHFIFRGEAEQMALVGDLVGFRYDEPMHRVQGTNLFYYSARVEPDVRLSYRFLRNLEEPLPDPRNPNRLFSIMYQMASSFHMPKWQKPSHLKSRENNQRGRIDSLSFKSTTLDSNITVEVYLPAGYSESELTYPVAYVHGAGGTTLGEIPQSLDYLTGKMIRPTIVVFVPRLLKGGDSFGYAHFVGHLRENYANIFLNELIPFVDQSYRTIKNGDGRANVGNLFSGFMAFYATFQRPDLFSGFAIQSMYWDEQENLAQQSLVNKVAGHDLRIYVDWGKYDVHSPNEGIDTRQWSRDFVKLLRANGFQVAGGEINEGTGWANWKNRTDKVFESLFPLKK